MNDLQKTKLQMAATIFAGMCSDEHLMKWARDQQKEVSNGMWDDHLMRLSLQIAQKMIDEEDRV